LHKATLLLSGAALAASLIFGGGTRQATFSDVVPELMALPLLIVAGPAGLKALRRQPLLACLFAGVITLFVLQLLPLPPNIWSRLPGREKLVQFYIVAGMPLPWQPLSLSPGGTWRAGLAFLPALTLFLGTLTLSRAERQVLLAIAVVLGVLSVPLGMLQVLGGEESALYFFQYTNHGSAVGFFANANHYAVFCCVLIPFAAALLSKPAKRSTVPPLAIFAMVAFALLLGLAMSRSRSALVLGVLSVLATFALILREPLRGALTRRMRWLVAIVGLAAVLPIVMAMGLLAVLSRFEVQQVTADARWTMARVTWQALRVHFPLGSGLGTFERVYQLHEPAQAAMWEVINHAHNDWLELILETGAVGLVLVIAFFVWCGRAWARSLASEDAFDRRIGQAAGIAIALVSLHSLWDYPLRTIALSTLFGLCCALLIEAPEPMTSRGRGRSQKEHSRSVGARSRAEPPIIVDPAVRASACMRAASS
jgi:O-antigen ligase